MLASWKLRKVLLVVGFVVVAGGAAAAYAALNGRLAGTRSGPTETAIRPSAVVALGRIEPRSEIINIGAGASQDRLESLFVARGDLVKKGDVMGYLGSYAEQIAQRDFYQAQLREAELRLKTEIELNQSRVEAAEIHQRQILEVSPQRIAAQESTISSLEAKLANDKDILNSQAQLFSKGATSRRLQDDQKTIVLQGEANVASANAHLTELQRQFEVDKVDAEAQIRVARAQLERSKAEFPIASLERQIASAEARAKRLSIYAPIDGRILNIKVKPGEDVGTGPLLTMGDTQSMRAVAEVYETDIGRVRVGQLATVTSYALPRPISGRVVRIGSMVFKNDVLNVDPAARADARVVEVWVELTDDRLTQQLTNLTVNVEIDTSAVAVSMAPSDRP